MALTEITSEVCGVWEVGAGKWWGAQTLCPLLGTTPTSRIAVQHHNGWPYTDVLIPLVTPGQHQQTAECTPKSMSSDTSRAGHAEALPTPTGANSARLLGTQQGWETTSEPSSPWQRGRTGSDEGWEEA